MPVALRMVFGNRRKGEKMNESKRIIWIDNVKVIAMILVALCHFSQSMAEASIVAKSAGLVFFNEFCYLFHIEFLFIIKGYLNTKIDDTLSGVLHTTTAPHFRIPIIERGKCQQILSA